MSRVLAALNWPAQRRSLVYPALMSFGFGVLASCAEKPPAPPPQTVAIEPPLPPAPAPPPRRRVFPRPAHKPSPPPENVPSLAQSDTQAMAFATAPPAPHPPSPSQLIGLDQPGATRLLGTRAKRPRLRRQPCGVIAVPPASWTCSFISIYAAGKCEHCTMPLKMIGAEERTAFAPSSPPIAPSPQSNNAASASCR